jgi:hypothetical protein
MLSHLLNNKEAAAYIGITAPTLDIWRCTKRFNIPYIRVGRLIKYRQETLDTFLASRTIDIEKADKKPDDIKNPAR